MTKCLYVFKAYLYLSRSFWSGARLAALAGNPVAVIGHIDRASVIDSVRSS